MPAHVTARQTALTLLNEAIRAIDACEEPHISTHEIAGLILEAREHLTNKPWPESATAFALDAESQSWLLARMADQFLEGTQ